MSCSELTTARLKLSNNLLLLPAFACWVLVCFVSHVIIFFGSGKQANAVSEGFSEKHLKTIQKMVMEYFSNKVAEMQPEKL